MLASSEATTSQGVGRDASAGLGHVAFTSSNVNVNNPFKAYGMGEDGLDGLGSLMDSMSTDY